MLNLYSFFHLFRPHSSICRTSIHLFIRLSDIHSFIHCVFIHSFICWAFINSFIHLSVRSSFIHSSVRHFISYILFQYILFYAIHAHVYLSVNLELHSARDIMAQPPVVVHIRENIMVLADLLLNTNHGGFPVVRRASSGGSEVYFGSINRYLLVITSIKSSLELLGNFLWWLQVGHKIHFMNMKSRKVWSNGDIMEF